LETVRNERVRTPDEFHVMDILTSRYKVSLFARTISEVHLLTQYSPLFIEISWPEESRKLNCYTMRVARNERTKAVYAARDITLEEVSTVLGRYCKAKSAEEMQMRLF
jgi:hypothetical protein